MNIRFISDKEIYKSVVLERIPFAKNFLWIGTSDLKDMYVSKKNKMVPFLEILSDLAEKKVSIRLIHAKEPGEHFRNDFDRYPYLIKGLEMMLCPRVHFKTVVIDGTFVYSGSANLTGAGMGSKSERKRNFENGFISTDTSIVEPVMSQFDRVWMGAFCKDCSRKQYCFEHL